MTVLDVSIFAFQHKVHVGSNNMGPRNGIVRSHTSSMRIFGDGDTCVGRHAWKRRLEEALHLSLCLDVVEGLRVPMQQDVESDPYLMVTSETFDYDDVEIDEVK